MGSKNFDHPQTLLEQRETHAAARVMVGLMTGGNGNRNEMEGLQRLTGINPTPILWGLTVYDDRRSGGEART
jgi:hypothetical protein